MAFTEEKLVVDLAPACDPPHLLLTSTAPAPNARLHRTLAAGDQVRALAAVTIGGSDGCSPLPGLDVLFSDLRSVPVAVSPLPNAGGVRGGQPSYAAQQGSVDFHFDYGFAFCLHQSDAFTKRGFGSTCIGSTCKGKVLVYSRGLDPFVWDRKRNRGGAIICPGGGGHLLCLRCLDAMYAGGQPFVSTTTGGTAIDRGDLFRKYEAFPASKELKEAHSGQPAAEGGHQFFVQRRDLAACPYCKESRTSKRGRPERKRLSESGPTPKTLGSVAILGELKWSAVPPTIIAAGFFLLPQLDVNYRLLDISLRDGRPVNVPRLVQVDHLGNYKCMCGQRACREHEVGFLRDTSFLDDWWQSASKEVEPPFGSFSGGKSFAREVTGPGLGRVLPLDRDGHLGVPLIGLNAEAWLGPQLRAFVTCEGADDSPAVCVLAGRSAFCSRCSEQERCPHIQRVLSITGEGDGVQIGPAPEATRTDVQRGATNSDRRAERSALRASGQRKLQVCNDPVCRKPDTKVPCTHGSTLEEWECLPAAALDMGHSHKVIDTVMSRGGQQVTSLCERWGDEGVRLRDEVNHFCAPRPVELLSPCGRPWQLERRLGTLTMAGARYAISTYRRVCTIAPGREAACCSVAYDGQEDGIFNFSGTTLISHGLLLRNHFAAALGASHSLNFDANDMATRSLEGPDAPRLDDRVFDAAMQAFNELAARPRIQHVCGRPDCAHLYTSEVQAAEAEAERAGCPLKPERTEGSTSNLATYAFSRDKVVTFDGTFFPNSSAMRDSSEAILHSICEPDRGAPHVAGGFTPLSIGGVRPSNVPLEGIDCPWKFRNGLSELKPAVRAAAFRWCNFRKAPAQGSNTPLSAEEFVAMRQGLPANPYAALLHALLIPRYSWVFGHIVTLKLLRHLLLEGPVDNLGLAYLTNDGPMLAAILRLHPSGVVQAGPRQYAFPATLRPLLRDIYATNLLCFEPSANRPSASGLSPLAALLDATEHLWALERERLRSLGNSGDPGMVYAEQRGFALKGAANALLFELEVREPQCYGSDGFLREASATYRERVGAVSIYDFHPLLYGRPQFTDWEDASGRGKKGSEERLAQHCGAPNPRSSKGRAGTFIACCQDRAPLGYHWLKGGESVSDLGTVLITRFPFKTLRGLTIVEDAACNAQEWFLNRVPQLAKYMLFLVDRFHSGPISCAPAGAAKRYATHTCSPTLFIDSYPQHDHTITTASEGINSGLKRSAASLQQITSIRRLMSRVTTILDTLFERSKYAVFQGKNSVESSPLRELIRASR
ncbi:hypothetical protein KFL_005970060 [Klebsormidium nitens]|uniref:HMG domain-containing protein n=1 Tax=Klebsormidium nitens TaxID=105231 RepID=A0A1Y1IGU4_KLENI|nr:hypothetical protein KFL_005970060 [Klebsormidium nitens]|eukprot:GAQ90085.1 hypothetical protein KFL_005970060 [Klebsormidium nitens]